MTATREDGQQIVRATRFAQVGDDGLQFIGSESGRLRRATRTRVLLLSRDLHVRVINAAGGELLRELATDPARDYQPTGRPRRPAPGPRPASKNPEP
jgi:hypothetical protein